MCPYAQHMNSGKDGKFSYRLKEKIHQFLETKKYPIYPSLKISGRSFEQKI
jgi:hypothetical protein